MRVSVLYGVGDQSGKSAAGAVAAAARELRPVEIVGIYESQREELEVCAQPLM